MENPHKAPAGSRDVLPQRLKPCASRRSRCRHHPGPSRTYSRPGVPTSRHPGARLAPPAPPEPPHPPRTLDLRPDPSPALKPATRGPRCPSGRDLGTGRPQLSWALSLDLGDAVLSPRPAPSCPSCPWRHAPTSGLPRLGEDDELEDLESPLAKLLQPGLHRLGFLGFCLPLQATSRSATCSRPPACFLLLRRKRYQESSPYQTHDVICPTHQEG